MSDYGFDAAKVAFEASLRQLGLDHVDLYLLHQPVPSDFDNTIAAYKAAETFLADGRARAIGVCNFSAEHLRTLIAAPTSCPRSTRSSSIRTSPSPRCARSTRARHRHPGLVADRRHPRLRARQRRGPQPARPTRSSPGSPPSTARRPPR